ncbi:deoxyribonuclease IV [Patescibacteria group bacterium]|nr:MAG: deoxyribonuclease IV [Patescibacteria group bacterium]
MKFGAHVSAAGGLWNGPKNAAELGCEVFQMFSRPPQGGKPAPITPEVSAKFQDAMKEHGQKAAYIHAPYFINLASSEPRIRHSSVGIIRDELERGSALGCRAVMFHPGSAKDVGQEKGLEMVIEGIDRVMDRYEGDCQLLIEISAGAGMVMGDTFEEIAAFLDGARRGKEIGVCFDTQHAFASGYDLRTAKAVRHTFDQFDELVGLDRLVMSHCNDSLVDFEAHKDRHEHLGKGKIGLKGFQAIVSHPKIQHLDLILETPWDDGVGEDLRLLKGFRKA